MVNDRAPIQRIRFHPPSARRGYDRGAGGGNGGSDRARDRACDTEHWLPTREMKKGMISYKGNIEVERSAKGSIVVGGMGGPVSREDDTSARVENTRGLHEPKPSTGTITEK